MKKMMISRNKYDRQLKKLKAKSPILSPSEKIHKKRVDYLRATYNIQNSFFVFRNRNQDY